MLTEVDIKCFLSLCETLNFTRTAKELFMTQQAISKNISKMEERLGFPLFERNYRSVSLTPLGRQLYMIFSRVSSEIEDALEDAKGISMEDVRTIRIGYQNWLDFGMAPNRALRQLKQKLPNTYLLGERQSPVILMRLLMNKQVDLVILYDRFIPELSGLKKRKLLSARAVLMVSTDNPLATPDASYKTFLSAPLICDSFEDEKSSDINARVKSYVESYGLNPSKVIIMQNRDSSFTAAESGQGIVISSELNRMVQSSALRCYPLDGNEDVMAVWRDGDTDPIVEEFANLFALQYEKQP